MTKEGYLSFLSETQAESDARAQDMRRYWDGFEKFKKDNPEFETEMSSKVFEALDTYEIPQDRFDTNVAKESLMVFIYSAELARSLYPALTKDVPVPRVIVNEAGGFESFCQAARHGKGYKTIFDSWFEARLTHILFPGNNFTVFTERWFLDNTSTVSDLLEDRVIVDLASAGFEEYAHELFVRKKSSDKLQKSVNMDERVKVASGRQLQNNKREEARVLYHTSDIERRGVVWKHRMMEKYFPHWAGPAREFVDEVSNLRIKNLAESRKSFWQKMRSKLNSR